jgi:hypothetical protein
VIRDVLIYYVILSSLSEFLERLHGNSVGSLAELSVMYLVYLEFLSVRFKLTALLFM